MRFTFKKKIAVAVVAVAAVAGTSIGAYAYFTATGSGSGQASVGSSTAWGVAVTMDNSHGPVLPGGGYDVANYVVTNNSAGHQNLTSVVVTLKHDGSNEVWNTNGNVYVAGCDVTWFGIANSPPVLGDYAPSEAHGGNATITLTNEAVPQDACQGIYPEVDVTAS